MTAWPTRLDLRAEPDLDLEEVVAHVRRGGLIAYPTETVYGLGGAVTDDAVHALRGRKGREADKPFIVLVESSDAVQGLGWTPAARALAEIFWPGPLTLVLDDPSGIFPVGVRDERTGAVGVRVSPHPLVARLVEALGDPLTSTSLNEPGAPPAASGTEAVEVVRALDGRDVVVLDAGTLPSSLPSTVVDCRGPEPVVLRAGSVPTERLRCAIPEIHGE
ncbi:MAG: L-threonylcarbamoyladenylate synthase [Gemmatimonadota bacterium]|jgi:L-threonylcarbamoyladenylate synthase